MAEFLLELYSEEIPHGLQISARKEIKQNLLKSLEEESIKFKSAEVYSTPTRLALLIHDLPSEIKIAAKEVKGPKVGVPENIIEGFMRSHQITKKDLFEKIEEKGKFYCFKKLAKKIQTEDLLVKLTPKAIGSVNWKKSMRWSDHDLMWGRPLRSILAIFNNKHLKFDYHHLTSTDGAIIVDNFIDKIKKVKNFKEYESLLKTNKIFLKQEDRKNNIIKKFQSICKTKSYLESFNEKLLEEVVNITENPNVILADFDKEYLVIPKEIIISTLQRHQRYFPLFDSKNRLTNNFLIVTNKPDTQNIIREGNKRVVLARLSDAKFFWEKDKVKNLIKQIGKLKETLNELKKENKELMSSSNECVKLRLEVKQMKDQLDFQGLQTNQQDKLIKENKLLKDKLKEFTKEDEGEHSITDISNITDFLSDSEEDNEEELMDVNVPHLRKVLFNRLRDKQAHHIEDLINTYNLKKKNKIKKSVLEKMLEQAIHL